MNPRNFSNSHGAVGKIIKIELPNLVVEDREGIEKIFIVSDETVIKSFRETLKPSDLKAGEFVVIVGDPDDKTQIEAKLIRIIPPSEFNLSTSTRAK